MIQDNSVGEKQEFSVQKITEREVIETASDEQATLKDIHKNGKKNCDKEISQYLNDFPVDEDRRIFEAYLSKPKTPWVSYEAGNLEMPLFMWCFAWFYQCRYTMARVIRYRLFRIFGIEITIGGVLFFLIIHAAWAVYAYFVITKSTTQNETLKSVPNSDQVNYEKTSGIAASVPIIFLFSLAGRNTLWGWLLGISYERLAIWHKLATHGVLLFGAVHIYFVWNRVGSFQKITGWILLISFAIMYFLSSIGLGLTCIDCFGFFIG